MATGRKKEAEKQAIIHRKETLRIVYVCADQEKQRFKEILQLLQAPIQPMSRHVTAITIRCGNDKCDNLYQISLSANADRHDFEISFAQCPHCRQARDVRMLVRYWGKPRCWGCQLPFELIPEHSKGMCFACYSALWKQARSVSKDIANDTIPL